ncbi:ParB/RepB/Spo0J family partition protein [Patescibacteria group bacterium]|nr:ParB/RepB/Spo0J family partition protein [Patescibacteria group bacterium]
MSEYQNNSIFWVETEKIKPNPFQPRRDFEPRALEDLADSIRQYGILQPLTVTRKETLRPNDGGMDVHYELIAGERRLRAAKLAQLQQIPVIIRKDTDDKVKLELAIIENLQREDLNPIDRALAFEQLHKQFDLTHVEIGKRMGKSRVYVSNTLRLLSLPDDIKQGLMNGRITEGHTRPLLMLSDRPEEQTTLYKEIMVKKLSVRDAEKVARKVAQDRVRKKEFVVDPKIRTYEKQLSENLGTRVHIEPKENGGQITIDYFTLKDLEDILVSMKKVEREETMMDSYLENTRKPNVIQAPIQEQETVLSATTSLGFNREDSNPTEDASSDVDTTQYHESFEVEESLINEITPPTMEEVSEPVQEEMVDPASTNQEQNYYQYPEYPPRQEQPTGYYSPAQPPVQQQPQYYNQPPQQIHYQPRPQKKGLFGKLFG